MFLSSFPAFSLIFMDFPGFFMEFPWFSWIFRVSNFSSWGLIYWSIYLEGCCTSTPLLDHIPYSNWASLRGQSPLFREIYVEKHQKIVSNLQFEVLGYLLTKFVL
jgi:hypothetical protein